MRVGIVCPYSLDVPGGVQNHVLELATELRRRGHGVKVLAPGDQSQAPDGVTTTGKAVAIPYNGSVARLSFGPVVASKVRRWLEAGNFDVVHVHEPATPSVGLLTVRHATGVPLVGTFHTSMEHSRAMHVMAPVITPILEKIGGRIAVSAEARRTMVQHLGGDPVTIPNGVDTSEFRTAQPDPAFTGTLEAPTFAFLGRVDEPRKGLAVLANAIPTIVSAYPNANFFVAGGGETTQIRTMLGAHSDHVTFLGRVDDAVRAQLLASVDIYIAPQTGGESFGIVLVEAMSAGALVVASDLPAFELVLNGGKYGHLFHTGDANHLAKTAIEAAGDRQASQDLAKLGQEASRKYDWRAVATRILAVYSSVIDIAGTRVVQARGERTAAAMVRKATRWQR